jgi:hypothetical protein
MPGEFSVVVFQRGKIRFPINGKQLALRNTFMRSREMCYIRTNEPV